MAFEQGSRAKAMNVLRVPMNRLNKQQMPFILLGLFLGFTISLIVYAIVALATTPHHTDPVTKGLPPPLNSYPHFVPVWLMFRGLVRDTALALSQALLLLLLLLLLIINAHAM